MTLRKIINMIHERLNRRMSKIDAKNLLKSPTKRLENEEAQEIQMGTARIKRKIQD